MKKRFITVLLCLAVMVFAMTSAMGNGTQEAKGTSNASATKTLHLFGPGLFAAVGEKGTLDVISGIELPGYKVLLDRWSALHPDIKIDLQAQPWNNWQAAIQTAVLSGNVDIILHGASLVDLAEPLAPYLAKDKEFANKILATCQRNNPKSENFQQPVVTGIPYSLNPMLCILDTKIFKDYGIELPKDTWTWSDMLEMGKKLTGTDPVTGKQTYGVQLVEMEAVGNRFFNYQMIASAYDAKTITYGKTLADSSADFTGAKTTKVFKMIQDLSKYCSPNVREGVNVNKTISADNNVAIRWDQGMFNHYNEIVACKGQGRFVYMTMPVIEEGANKGKPSLFMGDNNVAICKSSNNKELAWEFIKFLMTDDVATQWLVDTMSFPNNKEGFAKVQGYMGDYAKVVNTALEKNPDGFNNATNDFTNNASFGSVTSDIGLVIGELTMGNMKPEDCGKYVQDKINDFMKASK